MDAAASAMRSSPGQKDPGIESQIDNRALCFLPVFSDQGLLFPTISKRLKLTQTSDMLVSSTTLPAGSLMMNLHQCI